MKKQHSTKKALLASVMALCLCFTMLIGSTFAWFTDTAESKNNVIKTGTLEIGFEWAKGTEDPASAAWADASQGAIFNSTLWEPGYVEARHIKVENKGTLALKYEFRILVNGAVDNLAEVIDVYYVDPAAKVESRAALTEDNYLGTLADMLDTVAGNGNTAAGVLSAGESDVVTLVLKMKETANNEYQNKKIGTSFTVQLFATQMTAETDSFDDQYDKYAPQNVVTASTPAAAQAALDNAAKDTVLMLAPDVNYGTLYLRPYAGGAATKNVDWIGNNYGWETYTLFENLTIVGAEGATVDAIEIEGGTYYYSEHSQDAQYPVMLSLVELKNVVLDGVTFTGNGGYDPQGHGNVINLSGGNIKVDGLTVKNCTLKDASNNNRLIYKTESTTHLHNYAYDGQNYTFTPSLKNITVTGCTLNGGYMGLELRETENLTITNNEFNVSDRNILLPVNTDCTYSGTITITGNVSNDAKERFVRADGTGPATVIIANNTLNRYAGSDTDYIKVTNADAGCVTIENNVLAVTTD